MSGLDLRRKYECIPPDHVNFTRSTIGLGQKIALFFMRGGYSKVTMEYDMKNSIIYLEGTDTESGCRIYSLKYRKQFSTGWHFFLSTQVHRDFVDFTRRDLKFPAKKVSDIKIKIENVPMLKIVRMKSIDIDIENDIFRYRRTVPDRIKNHAKVNGLSCTDKIIAKVRRQKTIESVPKPIDKLPSLLQEPKKMINEKEIGNIWGFETPREKLPSAEERQMMDRVYKKQILGQ